MAGVFAAGLFAGRVAIVTGGGTGIGRAVARQLIELGCDVTVASRRAAVVRQAADELGRVGPGRCCWQACDIRSEEDVARLMDSCLQQHGRVDFLVNNGGGQFLSKAADIRRRGWEAVVATNLTGTFAMCQAAHASWMRQHGGVIVNMLADMFRGFPLMCHTGASRAGVENLTRSLAVEWAEHGVRVNAVAPGIVYSATAAQNYAVDVFGAASGDIPARRCGSTDEVAAAVCFLLSPAASYITGATLRVDGGSSLYSRTMHRVPDHSKLPAYRGQTGPDQPISAAAACGDERTEPEKI